MSTGMKTVNWAGLSSEEQAQLLSRPAMADSATLGNTVADIIKAIRTQGDSALLDYTKRFDKLEGDCFTKTEADNQQATARLGTDIKDAINMVADKLNISKHTVYLYIRQIKSDEAVL